MLNLRPYQIECLEAIKSFHSKGQYRQLVSLPTGAGKTVIFAKLINDMGCRALILAHTCELLEQAKEKIKMICPQLEVGIVNSESKEFDAKIVISSIQAANHPSNLSKLAEQGFDLVIADEGHHFANESSRRVIDALGFGNGTNRLIVGFTATPFRQDGKGLAEVFDVISYQKTIKELIDEGFLSLPVGLKIATDLDLSNVKSEDGDFQPTSLAKLMDTPEMNKVIVEAYQKSATDRPAICFSVNVEHAKSLAKTFQTCGVSSKAIYGEMSKKERASILQEYKRGEITVLCNCQVLTEGFDAPETSCVIIARPTKSKGLYQQMAGRGLRLWPNKKDCMIIDFGDVNHTICNTAILLHDLECEKYEKDKEFDEEKRKILNILPPKLNKKLKSAILNFDPIGDSFTWTREESVYVMKGSGKTRLEVSTSNNDHYKVVLLRNGDCRVVADGLSFEYAFASAEDFAKENKKLFVLSDQSAKWREEPISEKQKSFIRARGYKAGLEDLTRGQAAVVINSLVGAR